MKYTPEEQRAYERRRRARWLLFHKANGRMSNLKGEERRFLKSVIDECYQLYLQDRATGISRWDASTYRGGRPKPLKTGERVYSRHSYGRKWYGGSKANFQRFDIPRMLKEKRQEQEEACPKSRSARTVVPAVHARAAT